MTSGKKFISIKRENFGRKNRIGLLILTCMTILLGIMGIYLNWKNGVCALGVISIIYLIQKKFILKFYILLLLLIALISASNFLFKADFIETLLITLFLSFSFFLKPILEPDGKNKQVEIFYLDAKEVKCLATKDFKYKGYALDPMSYYHTYATKDITSYSIKGKNLLLSFGGELIRPRELSSENIKEIKEFMKDSLPYLLTNESPLDTDLEAENKFYLFKLLLFSPLLIFSVFIYFFADNGRNESLTFLFILLIFIFSIIIYKTMKPK